MTDLRAGQLAPNFSLLALGGKSYSLTDLLTSGPVVLAFFKISCPVCQFTFPFLQRLHELYGTGTATIVSISQDDPRPTQRFNKEYDVNFLTLVDPHPYPVSNSYTLTNVPTIFLIEQDRTIKLTCMGFSKSDLETISADLASRNHAPTNPLFRLDEIVPAFKPG